MSLASTHSQPLAACGTRCNGSGCLVTINGALIRAARGRKRERDMCESSESVKSAITHTLEICLAGCRLYGPKTRAEH